MKKLSLLLIILILFSCSVQQPVPEILGERILIFGDSITQDGRYVSVIEYKLFKQYPQTDFDIVSIGLSSETVSGLTEQGHPYPRPCVLGRLDSALAALHPAHVVACYGMNDGIYHPQSPERMQAYENGYNVLIEKVKASGADLIILTPPFFDSHQKQTPAPADAEKFGYQTPFIGYNDVLADYAEWAMSLDDPAIQVVDLNTPMKNYVEQLRVSNPDFYLAKDGVHPGLAGHILMADEFLKHIGVPMEPLDPQEQEKLMLDDPVFAKVQERRLTRSFAWLVDIGHDLPAEFDALPVQEAEEKAAQLKKEIKAEIAE